MIAKHIQDVKDRVAAACARAGRDPRSVTLVAVSKRFAAASVAEARGGGLIDFGENYIQELREKAESLADPGIRWHFIGHLQTNKVGIIAPWIHLIHSVDSLRLGEAISRAARKAGRTIPVLVEVNTTGESSKFGLRPEETVDFSRELREMSSVDLQGLMTMGPMSGNPDDSRPAFRMLRGLRDRIAAEGATVPHLSMGMTGDFEVAIEEGATILRVGTAIFGPRGR